MGGGGVGRHHAAAIDFLNVISDCSLVTLVVLIEVVVTSVDRGARDWRAHACVCHISRKQPPVTTSSPTSACDFMDEHVLAVRGGLAIKPKCSIKP